MEVIGRSSTPPQKPDSNLGLHSFVGAHRYPLVPETLWMGNGIESKVLEVLVRTAVEKVLRGDIQFSHHACLTCREHREEYSPTFSPIAD